jgi:WD40 repeat protein
MLGKRNDSTPKKTPPPKQRKQNPPVTPRKYSLRSRGVVEDEESSTKENSPNQQKSQKAEIQTPESFGNSAVFQYVCSAQAEGLNVNQSAPSRPEGLTVTISPSMFAPAEDEDEEQICFVCSDLAQIYSIDFSQKFQLLAGGGHNGQVCIWAAIPTQPEVEPLQSFKAHNGWISTVKLLDASLGGSEVSPVLLTASNDGTIRVWDLSKENE